MSVWSGYGALPMGGKHLRGILLAFALAVPGSGAFADPVTILALGDSLTAGYGLAAEDGFVPQMQAWLDEQGADVTVINGGVSGDTTAGGLARIGWALTDDVDAMIVALGANDYLRGIDPAASEASLDGILAAAAAVDVKVLLVGITAGANYGPDYRSAFDAVFTDLSERYDVPMRPDFFQALRPARQAGTLPGLLQGDGMHPNADGVALIVEDLGPAVIELARRVQQ